MTEIKPEQPQVKKNTAKRIIAGTLVTLGASYMIGKIGKADFENYQDGVAKNKQNIEDEQAAKKIIDQNKVEEARRQALKEKVNTGNDYLDSLILRTVEEKEPTKKIDADEIQKLDFDKPVAPDGIFMLPPGTNFVEGKLKMGFVDTQTGDFYDLNQYGIFDYEGVGDRPLWAYSQVTTPAETNPDARYKLVFYNDGENDISLIQDEKEFFTQVNNDIKSGNKGAFNIIDLNTDKKRVLDTKVPMYSYKGKEITSYNFGGYKDSKDTVVDHNDHHINEIKQHIHNLSQ